MKITAIIPSRGRSFQLLATIRTMQKLESGRHQVTYIVGCDSDDPETIGMCQLLHAGSAVGGQVTAHCFERTGSLGAMVNQMCRDVPGDVYCSMCDDMLVITPEWDQKIADAVARAPDGVFWWKTDEKRPATWAIVTHNWYAAAGQMFTEYFPFWWDDLWLLETWVLASEGPPLFIDAEAEDRPAKTMRMRDLAFWTDFYESRRPERIAEAKRIAAALGKPTTGITERFAAETCKLNPDFVRDIPKIEAAQGERAPPTPEYMAAKARAEALMKEAA